MSKNYFQLDREAKKALSDKRPRPEAFGGAVATTIETTTIPPADVEELTEVPEYPLNQD